MRWWCLSLLFSSYFSLNKYLFIPILQFDNITLLPRRLYIFLFGSQLKKNSYPYIYLPWSSKLPSYLKTKQLLNCIFFHFIDTFSLNCQQIYEISIFPLLNGRAVTQNVSYSSHKKLSFRIGSVTDHGSSCWALKSISTVHQSQSF